MSSSSRAIGTTRTRAQPQSTDDEELCAIEFGRFRFTMFASGEHWLTDTDTDEGMTIDARDVERMAEEWWNANF